MTNADLMKERIVRHAIVWWERHRPTAFTLRAHLENPTINMSYERDTSATEAPAHALGRAVAALIKGGTVDDGTRQLVKDLYDLASALASARPDASALRDKALTLRRAEVFLGQREVNDDTTPQPRKRVELSRRRLSIGD